MLEGGSRAAMFTAKVPLLAPTNSCATLIRAPRGPAEFVET